SSLNAMRSVTGRDISALLNARPVVLVGAHGRRDDAGATTLHPGASSRSVATHETCFATVAWAMPLSHDPAMLAFSIRERSRTFEVLRTAGYFSISTLDAKDPTSVVTATYCGNTTGHVENKAAHIPHELIRAEGERGAFVAPAPAAALSWLACEIESIQPAGDHMLVIAYVREARTRCGIDEQGRTAALDTLLCIQHDTFAFVDAEALAQSIP
ncbi:MAG: flavin reductase, partial [Raoultibacter sp.]